MSMRSLRISSTEDLTVIRVREHGARSWVEFRSPIPYHLWAGDDASPAERLHNALEGWHACILHAGDSFDLLPRHPDYQAVAALMER